MPAEAVKLTQFASSAGSAAKIGATDLTSVLAGIPASADPRLIVGRLTLDDAAAFQMDDDLALIQTVDFFPPIVDDPYLFGQIAAASALSNVYAMGGQPLTALNVVAFPVDTLGIEVLTEILRGGEDKVREADAVVVGGQTVIGSELTYGLALSGKAHPRFLLTNSSARVGDRLVLTKPIGTGVITEALRQGKLTELQARAAFKSMITLNGSASRAALSVGATCATDIAGFGLLGHALHIARVSRVTLRIGIRDVPVFDHAEDMLSLDVGTAGGARNMAYVDGMIDWGDAGSAERALLTDPQTSGGLLVAISPARLDRFLMRVPGAVPIGDVIQPTGTPLVVA